MNTILITGTVNPENNKANTCIYDVFVWAHQDGKDLKMVTSINMTLTGYEELWEKAKIIVRNYFNNASFTDGAYTRFLDHITIIH